MATIASFYNKSRSVITIRLNVEHLAILHYFPFLREVYNFINIPVFKQFKARLKPLLLNISWQSSDIFKAFGNWKRLCYMLY